MAGSVEDVIASLKAQLGADTDTELARRLRVNKSTVSSWRARGSVPRRFLGILDGDPHQFMLAPPLKWGEHEEAAFRVALFRFCRLMLKTTDISDFRRVLRLFSGEAYPAFWLMMDAAQKDLINRQGEYPGATTFGLLLHDDIAAGDEAVRRDQERIGKVLRGGEPWFPKE